MNAGASLEPTWWMGAACALVAVGTACLIYALAAPDGQDGHGIAARPPFPVLQQRLTGWMPSFGEHAALRARLNLAGYDGPRAIFCFRMVQMMGAGLGAAVVAAGSGESGLAVVTAALLGGIAGALLPHAILNRQARQRWSAIGRALPYAIELLSIGLSAGATVEAAALRAARELEDFAPELADELFLTAIALGSGQGGQREALSSDWRAFRSLLIQGERYGLSLLPSLRALAKSIRTAQVAACEEAAAKLGPRLTIPLILFFLPPIFLLVLTPSLLSLFHQ